MAWQKTDRQAREQWKQKAWKECPPHPWGKLFPTWLACASWSSVSEVIRSALPCPNRPLKVPCPLGALENPFLSQDSWETLLNHRLWRHRWRFSQYSSRPTFIVEICKNTYFCSYNFIPVSLKSMSLVFPHTLFQTQAPDFAKSQPLLRSLRFKPSFPVQISAAHTGEDV